jgi:hypothetical protein
MEFRRRWAPLIVFATYSLALLVPALMPSVQAKDALPPAPPAFVDRFAGMNAADLSGAVGPSEDVMAALHAQASAALHDLQLASARQ